MARLFPHSGKTNFHGLAKFSQVWNLECVPCLQAHDHWLQPRVAAPLSSLPPPPRVSAHRHHTTTSQSTHTCQLRRRSYTSITSRRSITTSMARLFSVRHLRPHGLDRGGGLFHEGHVRRAGNIRLGVNDGVNEEEQRVRLRCETTRVLISGAPRGRWGRRGANARPWLGL